MGEDRGVKHFLRYSVCLAACVLLSACDDADDEQHAQAVGLATASRPAPKPQKASLSIEASKRPTPPTALSTAPRFELFSQYSGQDIKQVTGVSGRTLWLCFTAPWCPHSNAMVNELKILAREEKGSVQVVQLDADAYPAIAEDFNITKVPTTVLYTEGIKLRTIEGAFNAASLRRYLHRVLSREGADDSILEHIAPSSDPADNPHTL